MDENIPVTSCQVRMKLPNIYFSLAGYWNRFDFPDMTLVHEVGDPRPFGRNNMNGESVSAQASSQEITAMESGPNGAIADQRPPEPTTSTDVDDPSNPLYRHRRTVTDFEYGTILGEGSYSTVLVGQDRKTGKVYAVKKLDKAHIVKNKKVKYVMIERDALSKMCHPGIVKLYWTFKDNRSLYYVLDLAKNGELYTYIRRLAPFDEDTTRFYAAEILLAIEHIHCKGVVHRDIKPENILLDDNMHIKITDFGSAKFIDQESPQTTNETNGEGNERRASRSFVGTAEYVSPELLRNDPTNREADWWALGCVIYQMLCGRSPFKAATDYLIFEKIKSLNYSFPENFPADAKDLIQRLLVLDPKERLGSSETGGVEALKEHPFFANVDWENIWQSKAPPLKEQLDAKLHRNRVDLDERDLFAGSRSDSEFDAWFGEEDMMSSSAHQVTEIPTTFNNEANNDLHFQHVPEDTQGPFSDPPLSTESRDPSVDEKRASVAPPSLVSDASIYDTDGHRTAPDWVPDMQPDEKIILARRILRRKGLFSKKRYLVLTDRPRLLYYNDGKSQDGSGGLLRCEIPWTSSLRVLPKSKSVFSVVTPERSYVFEDPENKAQEWVNIINEKLADSFGVVA